MSRNTIIFTICLVIVLGGGVYYFFFFNKDSAQTVTTTDTPSDVETNFVQLVSKLDPIVFNTAVLNDPRFLARQDIRTTIIPENLGRTDPFAPVR